MFRIQRLTADGFDKVVLIDEVGNTKVEVAPSCGATMVGFKVQHHGEEMNVVDHYRSAEDFKANVTNAFIGSKLSPFVCRINQGRYRFGDKELKIQKFYQKANALHGLLYDQAFEVTNEDANEQAATVSMKYDYEATDPGYPFRYNCMVTYTLSSGNKVTVNTRIMNTDAGLIPVQDGWHPYFTLGAKIDDCLFEFQSKELVEFDEELIPTGRLIPYQEFGSLKLLGDKFFDNCFTLNFSECQPMCVLRNPHKNIQVELHPDKSYPYLQMYTPSHRNSIALENISSVPDAFNNGMPFTTLEPRAFANFSTSYVVTSLS